MRFNNYGINQICELINNKWGYLRIGGNSTATYLEPTYVRSFSVADKDLKPHGLTFKPDGTEMYVTGFSSRSVLQYTLNTAWDISTATFTRNFSVAGQEFYPDAVAFKPDGTEMYIIGQGSDTVYQYTLSTAWNISTATFTRSFSVANKDSIPAGVTFKPDGTAMYIIGRDHDSVYQYTLSTAWNISTATFTQSFSVADKESTPLGVTFKPDGTEMFIIGASSDSVHQYTLSTAWNISTATFTRSFSVADKDINPTEVTFKSDGTAMYIIGHTSDSVHQYTLTPAWYIGPNNPTITTTYDGNEYDNPLMTLILESTSVTDNEITLIYRLGVLDLNGDEINMSGLATNNTDNVVHSNEEFLTIEKDDLTQWRWVYKIKLIR